MSSLWSLITTKTHRWIPKCAIQPLRLCRTASVEYDELFPLWQDNQLTKSSVKGHIVVFACLTAKEFHVEAATSLATVPVEVKIWHFITRRLKFRHIYSKKGTKYTNMLLREVIHEETKGLVLKIGLWILVLCCIQFTSWSYLDIDKLLPHSPTSCLTFVVWFDNKINSLSRR
jgi:hypothetical protein